MDRSRILEILTFNKGFDSPERWVEYAEQHEFKKVDAERLDACPNCGGKKFRPLGQFVYYSQLAHVQSCRDCRLIFSDVVLNAKTIQTHFEATYKDHDYFESGRRNIFEFVVRILHKEFPGSLTILDAGGGMGHLAKLISESNHDYRVIFNDVSLRSCEYAARELGLETICCPIEDLASAGARADVILLVDCLYYVRDLQAAWESLGKCLNDSGAIILRLPNRVARIRLTSFVRRVFRGRTEFDKFPGMSREHLYVFTRSYLRQSLHKLGCTKIDFRPSPLTASHSPLKRRVQKLLFVFAKFVHTISGRTICLTPSQIVIARRPRTDGDK